MVNTRITDAPLFADIKRFDTGARSQGIEITTPVQYLTRIEDLSLDGQESVRRVIEWVRSDPDGTGFASPKRVVSDGDIKQAISAADITALSDEDVEEHINIFSFVIQSGRMENFSIFGKNGNQTTTSIPQYLIWLTEERDSKDDGVYSPFTASI